MIQVTEADWEKLKEVRNLLEQIRQQSAPKIPLHQFQMREFNHLEYTYGIYELARAAHMKLCEVIPVRANLETQR